MEQGGAVGHVPAWVGGPYLEVDFYNGATL